jgi:hypothetical protein
MYNINILKDHAASIFKVKGVSRLSEQGLEVDPDIGQRVQERVVSSKPVENGDKLVSWPLLGVQKRVEVFSGQQEVGQNSAPSRPLGRVTGRSVITGKALKWTCVEGQIKGH